MANLCSEPHVCVLCMADVEENQEIVRQSCGHIFHLPCWLKACTPYVAADGGYDRYVEGRLAARCHQCRQPYAGATSAHLLSLLRTVEEGTKRKRKRVSNTALVVLNDVCSSPEARTRNGLSEEETSQLVMDHMVLLPLEDGDAFAALRFLAARGAEREKRHCLDKVLRGELQSHRLSTSGSTDDLAARIVENKLATRGLFKKLLRMNLLTEAQPLRSLIEGLLKQPAEARHDLEYEEAQHSKLVTRVVRHVLKKIKRSSSDAYAQAAVIDQMMMAEGMEPDEREDDGDLPLGRMHLMTAGVPSILFESFDAQLAAAQPREQQELPQGGDQPHDDQDAAQNTAARAPSIPDIQLRIQSSLDVLLPMGFDSSRARAALAATNGDVSAAVALLLNS
eukprot:jgi/Tetstr1/446456/TSEL_033997.t1